MKLVRHLKVGIWEHVPQTITIGPKYITVKEPYVRWVNNSGSLDYTTYVIGPADWREPKIRKLVAEKYTGGDLKTWEDAIFELVTCYWG